MARFARNTMAFLIAAFVTYLLAAVASTQSVMSSLGDMGVEVGFGDRVATTFADLSGMLPMFLPLLAVALLLGFLVAGGVVRWQPGWRNFGFPLAGFAAILVMHLLMRSMLDLTPVAAARSTLGLLFQGLAGAAGGYVYYLVSSQGGPTKASAEAG